MNVLIGICVVVITFVAVGLYFKVSKTLRQAGTAMEEAKRTIGELRLELQQVSRDAREVVQNTNEITLDAQKKMKELDALFGSVREIGSAAQALTVSVKEAAVGAALKARQGGQAAREAGAGKVGAIADAIASSIRVWNRLRQN
ncbi:DUF948 domain-containing protein [Paenibacillus soyae]|uniref:DUF948 domain-containing protein n=1 Tax=Paenibacillus soyae TaxID=2969249 RepID=A0A9X2MT87_9BACL|nr:DUF948 domain-containing protein [Paenibacillus soyae]MCR2806546.1 DUF948 domain-containing protein [Paenibacillus soyae]